jgi:hypothetical protein
LRKIFSPAHPSLFVPLSFVAHFSIKDNGITTEMMGVQHEGAFLERERPRANQGKSIDAGRDHGADRALSEGFPFCKASPSLHCGGWDPFAGKKRDPEAGGDLSKNLVVGESHEIRPCFRGSHSNV